MALNTDATHTDVTDDGQKVDTTQAEAGCGVGELDILPQTGVVIRSTMLRADKTCILCYLFRGQGPY